MEGEALRHRALSPSVLGVSQSDRLRGLARPSRGGMDARRPPVAREYNGETEARRAPEASRGHTLRNISVQIRL